MIERCLLNLAFLLFLFFHVQSSVAFALLLQLFIFSNLLVYWVEHTWYFPSCQVPFRILFFPVLSCLWLFFFFCVKCSLKYLLQCRFGRHELLQFILILESFCFFIKIWRIALLDIVLLVGNYSLSERGWYCSMHSKLLGFVFWHMMWFICVYLYM
jgi:hypothetical protein